MYRGEKQILRSERIEKEKEEEKNELVKKKKFPILQNCNKEK